MMWLARFFLLYLSYSHAALDSSVNFLPINQSFTRIIQFYSNSYYLALIRLEWFGILSSLNLLCCRINASIVAQLQFQNVDEVIGFQHHIYPTSRNHLLNFHPAADSIEDGTQDKTVPLFYIYAGKTILYRALRTS